MTTEIEAIAWQDDAIVVPADQIDWQAVAAGQLEAPVRQKPGPGKTPLTSTVLATTGGAAGTSCDRTGAALIDSNRVSVRRMAIPEKR